MHQGAARTVSWGSTRSQGSSSPACSVLGVTVRSRLRPRWVPVEGWSAAQEVAFGLVQGTSPDSELRGS